MVRGGLVKRPIALALVSLPGLAGALLAAPGATADPEPTWGTGGIEAPEEIVTAPDAGGGAHVRVFDDVGNRLAGFSAYDRSFRSGVRVAVGDVNGAGRSEIVTGPGPKADTQSRDVRVFTLDRLGVARRIGSFFAYSPSFQGGIYVAVGDVNGDGIVEIVTGAGEGGGPVVRVFDRTGNRLAGFLAYDPSFRGGVRVGTGDVDVDGRDEVITGAGPGGGPHVRVFDVTPPTGAQLPGTIGSFFAYPPTFQGGVYVAGGDVDRDGFEDVITGPGAGGGPHLRIFSGATGSQLGAFLAYDRAFRGGVRIAAGQVNGDRAVEIVTGPGPETGPHVRVLRASPAGPITPIGDFFAYAPSFQGGIYVAVGDVSGD